MEPLSLASGHEFTSSLLLGCLGNIKTNSNLLEKYGQSVLEQLELDFHQGPGAAAAAVYSYFRLDRKEGTLRTARPLDREQLWPLTDIELSIRVTPFTFFQVRRDVIFLKSSLFSMLQEGRPFLLY